MFHDANPGLVGDPTENPWGSATGNVHQGTTRGELLWHQAANRSYCADTAGNLWELDGTSIKSVGP